MMHLEEYQVGDRIVAVGDRGVDGLDSTKGRTGTVIFSSSYEVGIDFDEYINGHSCDGRGRGGHCRWCYNSAEIQLIETESPEFEESEELNAFIAEFAKIQEG